MANLVQKLGDTTSKEVRPDFDSGKGYYWMKMVSDARAAENGEPKLLPRKPRRTQAEKSFFEQVDRRLSRRSYTMGASFDKGGKLIREDQ